MLEETLDAVLPLCLFVAFGNLLFVSWSCLRKRRRKAREEYLQSLSPDEREREIAAERELGELGASALSGWLAGLGLWGIFKR